MLKLTVDEKDKLRIAELQTEDGKIMKVGDTFELIAGNRADEGGRELPEGTKVVVERIYISFSNEQIAIKGTLPDSTRFTGGLGSFNFNSREYVDGEHAGCGGSIIVNGQHRKCDKCEQFLCGCACG